MSDFCTCSIDSKLCWCCLYELQRQKNIKYENILKEISEMPKVRGVGWLESNYNKIIELAQMSML